MTQVYLAIPVDIYGNVVMPFNTISKGMEDQMSKMLAQHANISAPTPPKAPTPTRDEADNTPGFQLDAHKQAMLQQMKALDPATYNALTTAMSTSDPASAAQLRASTTAHAPP